MYLCTLDLNNSFSIIRPPLFNPPKPFYKKQLFNTCIAFTQIAGISQADTYVSVDLKISMSLVLL